jgi:ribonucleoside-diphosphate reductase beta chain
VDHEDAFIDLAFEQGPVEGLTAREVKEYIRFIADRRLIELGLNKLFHVSKNPLPWLDEMLNAIEHANFFENRATEYSKASTTGSWEEAFADLSEAGEPARTMAVVPEAVVPKSVVPKSVVPEPVVPEPLAGKL